MPISPLTPVKWLGSGNKKMMLPTSCPPLGIRNCFLKKPKPNKQQKGEKRKQLPFPSDAPLNYGGLPATFSQGGSEICLLGSAAELLAGLGQAELALAMTSPYPAQAGEASITPSSSQVQLGSGTPPEGRNLKYLCSRPRSLLLPMRLIRD